MERPTKHKVQNNLLLEISFFFFWAAATWRYPWQLVPQKVPTLIKVLRTSLLVMLPFQITLIGCKVPLKINSVYLNDRVRVIYHGHMTVPIWQREWRTVHVYSLTQISHVRECRDWERETLFSAWQSLAYCGKLSMTLWYWIFTFEDLITVMSVTINTLE